MFRNRDVDLVVNEDYWMFVVVRGDTYALPQNSLLKFVALLFVTAVVVHQISTSIESAFFWFVSLIDGVFKRLYDVSRAANDFVASERTGTLLTNIKRVLVILLLLLVLLNRLEVIDVAAIPKWLVPI